MMYHFILYSLKVAAVLAVFYLFYHLLLSRDTFHRLNRIVLLATAALSFVLARLAVSIFSIRRIIRGGERFPDGQGNTVVVTDKPVAPFSWLRYIVLSQTDWECEREKRPSEILLHEQAHIRYGHSLDVLVADCLGALQWFNPAIWLLKGDLRAIHEYEADAALLQQGINAKQYQSLLVRKAMASAGYSVANSFSHSTLKNRIAMMLKSKSPLAASLKLLYILPLVGLSLAATTRTVTDYEVRGAAAESLFTQVTTDGQDPYIQDLDKQKQDTVQFKLVDVLPQFKGLTPPYSKAFVQRMTEHYNNPWHFKMLDDSTAYLALRSFSLYRTQVDAIQDSLAAHRDAANLIFDVRDNPGGEDEVVRRIAGWFLDGPSVPLKSCSKVLSNTTYPILAHSKNYSADMEIFTEYTPVEGKEGFYAGYDSARVLQPDSVFHFGARLYFLTNEASVSAASLLPSILVRNHRAVTVGRETGTAYHFMTALKFADMILPHSWIQVRVPLVQCWFDETVMERTPFGRGLLPDYEVPLTAEEYYAEIPDPVLAKAQELIAAGQYLGPDPFAGVDARSSAVCLFRRLWLWSLLGGLAAAVLCGIFLLRKRFPRARPRS